MPKEPDVETVNLEERFYIMTDGFVGEITDLYDAWGDETDDPAEAVGAVGRTANGWMAIDLRHFEKVTLQ